MRDPLNLSRPAVATVSRRSLLKQLAASVAAAAVVAFDRGGVQAAPEPTPAATDRLDLAGAEGLAAASLWSKATFAKHVGQYFTVSPGGPTVSFKLARIEDGNAKIYFGPTSIQPASADACFQLVFAGPRSRVLKDKTYSFHQKQLGTFSLFITRGRTGADGQHYTAVVNRVQA